METDQSDSSAMSLEVKLMSDKVDRPFVGSHAASFSLTMVQSVESISPAAIRLYRLVVVELSQAPEDDPLKR